MKIDGRKVSSTELSKALDKLNSLTDRQRKIVEEHFLLQAVRMAEKNATNENRRIIPHWSLRNLYAQEAIDRAVYWYHREAEHFWVRDDADSRWEIWLRDR